MKIIVWLVKDRFKKKLVYTIVLLFLCNQLIIFWIQTLSNAKLSKTNALSAVIAMTDWVMCTFFLSPSMAYTALYWAIYSGRSLLFWRIDQENVTFMKHVSGLSLAIIFSASIFYILQKREIKHFLDLRKSFQQE